MSLCPEVIVANLVSIKPREATLDGKRYLVASLTTIVPGVLNGSQGALYYPPEEIARDHHQWNTIPIVVNHPVDPVTGKHLSASEPGVLNRQGIGLLRESAYKNKLVHEGWFDIEATQNYDRKHGTRLLQQIRNGDPVELSTGLYTDNVPQRGTFNGKPYEYIARNYRADHLAILPHQKGACSNSDGCGVNVNAKTCEKCGCAEGGECQCNATENQRSSMWTKLGELLGITTNTPKHPITGRWHPEGFMPAAHAEKGYKDATKRDENKDVVDDDVEKAVEDGADADTTTKKTTVTTTENEEQDMAKRNEMIQKLTTNCDCWKGDATTLNGFSDEKITKLYDQLMVNESLVELAKSNGAPADMTVNAMPAFIKKKMQEKDDEDDSELEPTENKKKPVANTVKDWFKDAPPEVTEVWNTAVQINKTAKEQLIKRLTANVKDPERRKRHVTNLRRKSIEDLREMLELQPVVPTGNRFQQDDEDDDPLFVGNGGTRDNDDLTNNSDDDDLLDMPVLNYAELAKERDENRRQA